METIPTSDETHLCSQQIPPRPTGNYSSIISNAVWLTTNSMQTN